MKKTIYSLLAITALLFSSCESFTELEPKGKNLLTTIDQLEMLLNKKSMRDVPLICDKWLVI